MTTKVNSVLISIKLSLQFVLSYVPLFKLIHVYNNNYNNNYSFIILKLYIPFSSYICSLFFSHDYSLLCLQPFCKQYTYSLDLHISDLQARNFKTDAITSDCRQFFCSPTRSVKRTFLKQKLFFSFSRLLYSDRLYMCILVYVFPDACCWWFI